MKTINLTLDNYFRNPLRWGRCPINIKNGWTFGVFIRYNELLMTSLKKRWVITFFFGKYYYAISNCSLL